MAVFLAPLSSYRLRLKTTSMTTSVPSTSRASIACSKPASFLVVELADSEAPSCSAELGVELFKSAGIARSASLRPSAFVGKDSQAILESGSSVSLAF